MPCLLAALCGHTSLVVQGLMQMSEIHQAGLRELMLRRQRSAEEGLGIAHEILGPNLDNKNSAELVR